MRGKRTGVVRLRALVFAAATFALVLCLAAAAQAAGKPVIHGLGAYPATVASGGTAGVDATVTGAGSCGLSSTKTKPIAGLEGAFSCAEGNAMRVVAMPANKGSKPVVYTLTLTAHAAVGKAKAKARVTVTVLPEETRDSDRQLIATGFDSSCAVVRQGSENGKVLCWGSRALGDLGDEGPVDGYSLTPVTVANVTNAVQVAAGGEHACALLSTGHIKCWGASIGLGNGVRLPEPGESTPVAVVDIANAVQISAGYADTCALLVTGHVDCWGFTNFGQLAVNTFDYPAEFLAPVEIPALTTAVEVAIERETICARVEGGKVECWGGNGHGQFGDGGVGPEHFTPVPVAEVAGANGIAAGENHMCAVTNEEGHPAGLLKCWGWDASGQLGDDNLGYIRKPEYVVGANLIPVAGALQAAAGYEHSCALFKGGTVQCWGGDTAGQLGDGAPKEKQTVAVPVGGLEHVVEIEASYRHTCALLDDGTIRCWGSDPAGELGNGISEPFSARPVPVAGFPPVSAAARRPAARHTAHRKAKRPRPHR
jgi:alpha-tubulin suppressor-like RCC1 family protein